jgi:transcriptional regulator with XRE-family HTH domain
MGRAGNALKQVLETYDISQNQLAVAMGIGRSTVHYWVNGTRDPLADTIPDIVAALERLNQAAAKDFLVYSLIRCRDDCLHQRMVAQTTYLTCPHHLLHEGQKIIQNGLRVGMIFPQTAVNDF